MLLCAAYYFSFCVDAVFGRNKVVYIYIHLELSYSTGQLLNWVFQCRNSFISRCWNDVTRFYKLNTILEPRVEQLTYLFLTTGVWRMNRPKKRSPKSSDQSNETVASERADTCCLSMPSHHSIHTIIRRPRRPTMATCSTSPLISSHSWLGPNTNGTTPRRSAWPIGAETELAASDYIRRWLDARCVVCW